LFAHKKVLEHIFLFHLYSVSEEKIHINTILKEIMAYWKLHFCNSQ